MAFDVYGTQTSNKLNTIAIPLAATPLCMVANIVLVLSLGDNISPNLIYITISSLDILSPLKGMRFLDANVAATPS